MSSDVGPLAGHQAEPRLNYDVSVLPTVNGGVGIRHEVVKILRQAIWDGRLHPGQRLNEQWIARDLGVSRPPLREAIRVLEQEGLVKSQPRRGAFVTNLTGADIMEIYVLRCALERTAAQQLVACAADDVFDRLESHLDAQLSPEFGLGDVIEHDLEFHRQLVQACGNRRLALMWEQMASQLRMALSRVDPAFFEAEFIEATHRELVRAMRARDVELVSSAVGHLLQVGESLRAEWDKEGPPVGERSS